MDQMDTLIMYKEGVIIKVAGLIKEMGVLITYDVELFI